MKKELDRQTSSWIPTNNFFWSKKMMEKSVGSVRIRSTAGNSSFSGFSSRSPFRIPDYRIPDDKMTGWWIPDRIRIPVGSPSHLSVFPYILINGSKVGSNGIKSPPHNLNKNIILNETEPTKNSQSLQSHPSSPSFLHPSQDQSLTFISSRKISIQISFTISFFHNAFICVFFFLWLIGGNWNQIIDPRTYLHRSVAGVDVISCSCHLSPSKPVSSPLSPSINHYPLGVFSD